MKNAVGWPETARVAIMQSAPNPAGGILNLIGAIAIMQSAPNPAGGILNLIGATRGKLCEESRLVCWRFSQNCPFFYLAGVVGSIPNSLVPGSPCFFVSGRSFDHSVGVIYFRVRTRKNFLFRLFRFSRSAPKYSGKIPYLVPLRKRRNRYCTFRKGLQALWR